MTTVIASRNPFDGDNRETHRESETACQIGRIDNDTKEDDDDKKKPLSVLFFAEQRDLVTEVFSFLDPPSLFKLCTGIPFVAPVLTHEHVIRSVKKTLATDTYNQDNECYRRNRHRYRHIQYHRIVVEKMIPNFQRPASTRQTPMQLLRAVSGRYCERCQLDLICVTGW